MPKYSVTLSQFVEERAEVAVYAPSARAAKKIAIELHDAGEIDPDWHDGEETLPPKVINVTKED